MALLIMMKCSNCLSNNVVRKGKRGLRQRLKCVDCGKYCQNKYIYKLFEKKDDFQIKALNAEGVGIRSMSRVLGYSSQTIIRRILYLKSTITKPQNCETNQVYEVDELWTYIARKETSCYCWITYGINRRTGDIIDVSIGSRTKENLGKVISTLKSLSPKKIITDKLNTYPNLVKPTTHDTRRYANNRIERANLTLRTHLKRLSRKTICYSKSIKMLEACVLLYLDFKYWNLKCK